MAARRFQILLSVVAAFSVAIYSDPASACSCIRTTVQEAIKQPSIIFTGKVIGPGAAFEVEIVWKGNLPKRVFVTGRSAHPGSTCDVSFKAGDTVTVAAVGTSDEEPYRTDYCEMGPFARVDPSVDQPSEMLKALERYRDSVADLRDQARTHPDDSEV